MKRSNPTILVVDDDPNDLIFMVAAFKAVGATAQIRTVDGGVEAIAYLKGEGKYSNRGLFAYPDFLITDLKMPEVDGFGVLEYLRQTPEKPHILSIMFSGSHDNDDIRKASLLGASSYHVKPNSPVALRVFVKALHDYWMLCEFPEQDGSGTELRSDSVHKLGARFASASSDPKRMPSAR